MRKNKMKKTETTTSPIEPQHYVMAELICQREFDKRFDTDLSKPVGRIIPITSNEERINIYKGVVDFWDELSQTYVKCIDNIPQNLPLKNAMFFLCKQKLNVSFEKLNKLCEELYDVNYFEYIMKIKK